MSTHRRAWKQRAGVVVALVVGALLTVPATPASAADATVSPNSATINAGSDATVSVTIQPDLNDKSGDISLTGLPSGVSCASGCGNFQFNGPPGSPKTVLLTLKANDNAGDATANVTVRVVPDVSNPATPSFSLTVKAKAPPQVQTVKSVSGKAVIAANGDPLPGIIVMLRDSQGKQRQTSTDSSGNFRFSGSTSDPIAPGRIDLGANKNGTIGTKSIEAAAGEAKTGVRIGVPIEVKASPSATPSAEEALPTDEATEEATDAPATEAAAGPQPASNEDSGGFGSWLLILLGGLFVAVGVGTIVLLYMRRKNEGDDADGDGPGGAGAVPAARGGYRGVDDQTRVVNGMGAGAAPTMVGGTSLSDAPTMMHRPVVDDVPPDPYGAPASSYGGGGQGGWAGSGYGDEPGQGGYGNNGYGNAPQSGGGYGNAPSSGSGYGNAPSSGSGYGNAPSSGGGYGGRDYGAGAGGYPPPQGSGYGGDRYDEPTGRYNGDSTQYAPPADPYPTSTYQPDQGPGYGQPDQGHYGRSPEPGYGAGGGYGTPSGTPSGGYDSGPSGGYDNGPSRGYDSGPQQGYDGYDQRGGYGGNDGYGQSPQGGNDGYGQQGGYGQEPPPQQRGGGYDNHGYDNRGYEQGGHYGDPAQAGRGRGDGPQERGGRRLDWLDD